MYVYQNIDHTVKAVLLPYLFGYKKAFSLSRMTTTKYFSPMKFCYNTSFILPKQSQRAKSFLEDGCEILGLFWKEKKSIL